MKHSYALKDGDQVITIKPALVSSYVYCPDYAPNGIWKSLTVLPGTPGTVVKAKTPCVLHSPSEPQFFANVDVEIMGKTYRLREFQNFFKKV